MPLSLPETLTTRDGGALRLRPLTSADAAALQRFNQELSDEARRLFLPHAYDDQTVARALARAEASEDLLLGLFADQRQVAYFFLWYATDPVPLLGIGLLDDYHRQGLGRQMMDVLLEAARATGREGVELTTQQDNDAAFALYRQMGFVHYGDVANVTGDGQQIVERGMFYALRPGAARMTRPHAPPV